MEKLVSVILKEPKNVICLVKTGMKEAPYDYYVPVYIAFGAFDSGRMCVTGILNLEDFNFREFNHPFESKELDKICRDVDLFMAKSFVMARQEDEDMSEERAKQVVLGELTRAQVNIDKDALNYLDN